MDKEKRAVLEALSIAPVQTELRGDSRATAIYLLKREGVPVVSHRTKAGTGWVMRHQLEPTALDAASIKAARSGGLLLALRWHREGDTKAWAGLIETIECPFAKDEARQYLSSILQRAQNIRH